MFWVFIRALSLSLALLPSLTAAQSPVRPFPPGTFQNRAALDAASGGGTVLFDAVSTTTAAPTAGTTLTWTHTPVGTPTAVAVLVECFGAGITGITYGGNAMALATNHTMTGGSIVNIYGLASPPSGAQTVIVTFGNTGIFTQGAAITVTASDTVTTFRASNSAIGTGTAVSTSVTSDPGDLVIDIAGTDTNQTLTPGGSQIQKFGPLATGGNRASGSIITASSASTTMTWTLGGSTDWGQVAASFKHP